MAFPGELGVQNIQNWWPFSNKMLHFPDLRNGFLGIGHGKRPIVFQIFLIYEMSFLGIRGVQKMTIFDRFWTKLRVKDHFFGVIVCVFPWPRGHIIAIQWLTVNIFRFSPFLGSCFLMLFHSRHVPWG